MNMNIDVKTISLSAVFTVIIFIFTVFFTIATPATRGFFNIGETGVYIAAIVGGPIVGAIAGGLGSALADLFLGYGHYAPGTLIIKGIEGFITGYIFLILKKISKKTRTILGLGAAIFTVVFLGYLGRNGIDIILTIGNTTLTSHIPFWIVLAIALLLAFGLIYASVLGGETSLMVFACLLGGIEMVLGYFLYEAFVLGFGLIAIAEIPINIGQTVIGTSIAVPLVKALMEMGVSVSSEESMG